MARVLDRPFIPSKRDASAAKQTLEQLKGDRSTSHFIVAESGQKVAVSQSIFKLLVTMLDEISQGNAVVVMPIGAEMTTKQGAEFLNISRPHLIKLLENGEIPYRMVGTHRKVLFEDLLNYKERTKHKRLKAIAKMTAEDDRMYGLAD